MMLRSMENIKGHISDELLAAFLDGSADLHEMEDVVQAMQYDPVLAEVMAVSAKVDDILAVSYRVDDCLPLAQRAALGKDALCDVLCEEYILRKAGVESDIEGLMDVAKEKSWLYEDGIPLHNIGGLMEVNGLFIRRMGDATREELESAIEAGSHVIVVVDAEILDGPNEHTLPDRCDYHSVVCLSFGSEVLLYNPSTGNSTDVYPKELFLKSWESAGSYMVCADKQRPEYVPRPLKLDDIDIEPELLDLTEAIAENAHEVWAQGRKNQGWTYGPVRNDELKQHPDMVAYSDLTESEKQYDRDMAFNTIKLVKKLGYDLSRRNWSGMRCPSCWAHVGMTDAYCRCCGEKLSSK
jgi:hypothetical protein